jgi:oxygen-independent coproporphyrinogen-3 oxidase
MTGALQHGRVHPSLPIFAIEAPNGRAVLYVPGHAVPCEPGRVRELRTRWRAAAPGGGIAVAPDALAEELVRTATAVQIKWDRLAHEPFAPIALTAELRGPCLQACTYCYADAVNLRAPVPLNRPAFAAACEWVARNCSTARQPFVLSVHGVGESTDTWVGAETCVDVARSAALQQGVPTHFHATTSGQLDEKRARWLARAFDAIDVSCDGPADVQNTLRPRRDGRSSAQAVEAAAKLWREHGVDLTMRATVTPRSLIQMRRLVEYAGSLAVRKLHVEPVYGRPGTGFTPADAGRFAYEFLEAQRAGARQGIAVETSAPRLDELHGPFCEPHRQTLRLTSDGTTAVCFRGVGGRGAPQPRMRAPAASYDATIDQFVVAPELTDSFRQETLAVGPACRDCLNQLHCTRACPDDCPSAAGAGSFRCRVQQALATQWIWQAAWRDAGGDSRPPSLPEARARLEEMSAAITRPVDCRPLVEDILTVSRSYAIEDRALPPPGWVDYGFDCGQQKAWETVCAAARIHRPPAVSIYLHVPFCEQKCLFCDCHSVRASGEAKRGDLVRRIVADIQRWRDDTPAAGWTVTTVHFGGGTPTNLGEAELARVVAKVSTAFAVTPDTEWAIEMTEAGLEPLMLDRLRRLGFRRIHVGVQTLQEPLRQQLGRPPAADTVLAGLAAAVASGFIMSVDLIYGLPEQTLDGWCETIDRLVASGIHGISAYALNLSRRNRRLLREFPRHRQDAWRDCLMLHLAEERLRARGFAKNHFAHFARGGDRNLYFRHAVRREPLIALGPSASGAVGNVEYRNADYPRYLADACAGVPLAGARTLTAAEMRAQPLTADLLAGEVQAARLAEVGAGDLISRWQQHRLLERVSANQPYRLSAAGSWVITAMQREIEAAVGCSMLIPRIAAPPREGAR